MGFHGAVKTLDLGTIPFYTLGNVNIVETNHFYRAIMRAYIDILFKNSIYLDIQYGFGKNQCFGSVKLFSGSGFGSCRKNDGKLMHLFFV